MKSKMVISFTSGLRSKWLVLTLVIISLSGCVKRIQPIDLSLPELLENYQQYEEKKVLLRGEISDKMPFGIYGVGFPTWFFFLESEGKEIRCFEWHYRISAEPTANYIILRARTDRASGKKAEVTVIGDLEKDGIELYLLEYQGITVRTDIKTPQPFIFRPFEPWY
jgi:hypothetical protein